MDLSSFDTLALAEQGVAMPLRGPGGALLEGTTITVAGADSERVKRVQRKAWDTRKNMGGRRNILPSSEEAEADAMETAVTATLGWEGIEIDGKVLEFSPAYARTLYKSYPWIRRQVEAFRDDELNFIKANALA